MSNVNPKMFDIVLDDLEPQRRHQSGGAIRRAAATVRRGGDLPTTGHNLIDDCE